MEDNIHTRNDRDLRYQMCKCSVCGLVAQCTPACDFYGEEGELLVCERCMMKKAGVDGKAMLHLVPKDGKPQIVSREEYEEFVK